MSSAQVFLPPTKFDIPDPIRIWEMQNPNQAQAYSSFKALIIRSEFLASTVEMLFFVERQKNNGFTIMQEKLVVAMKDDWKTIETFYNNGWRSIETSIKNNQQFHSPHDDLGRHRAMCHAVNKHREAINVAHCALENLLTKLARIGMPLEPPALALRSLISLLGNNAAVSKPLFRKLVSRFLAPAYNEAA